MAAGSGQRFGGAKQFEMLADNTLVDWAAITPGSVHGGASRSDSVRCGLAAVPADATIICVHDAARPFASTGVFRSVIEAIQSGVDGAVPAVDVVDTIKTVNSEGVVMSTPDRSMLRAVQTPQAFRATVLRRAYDTLGDGSDDAALVEKLGGKVVVVQGTPAARKITTSEDLEWARQYALSLTHSEI